MSNHRRARTDPDLKSKLLTCVPVCVFVFCAIVCECRVRVCLIVGMFVFTRQRNPTYVRDVSDSCYCCCYGCTCLCCTHSPYARRPTQRDISELQYFPFVASARVSQTQHRVVASSSEFAPAPRLVRVYIAIWLFGSTLYTGFRLIYFREPLTNCMNSARSRITTRRREVEEVLKKS